MFISATTVLVAVDVFLKIKNGYSWEDDTLVHNHILEADSKTNYKFSQWMLWWMIDTDLQVSLKELYLILPRWTFCNTAMHVGTHST